MKYLLKKSKQGAQPFLSDVEINVDSPILDFCWTPKGVVFISDDYVGLVTEGKIKYPWIRKKVDGLVAVSYNDFSKTCYLSGDNGTSVYKLGLMTKSISPLISSEDMKKHMHIPPSRNLVDFAFDRSRTFFWANGVANKIFCIKYKELGVAAGCGKAGFSVSTRLTTSLLSCPCGLLMDGQTLYVVEKDNRCIRKIEKGKMTLFAGNPKEGSLFTAPTKITKLGQSFFVLDGDDIHSVFLMRKETKIQKAYTGNKIVSIHTDDKQNLLVLERGN